MRIEIVHLRSEDGACTHQVFVDGAEVEEFDLHDIDPGRGWEREAWDEHIQSVRDGDASPAVKELVLELLDEASDSSHIV